MQYTYSFTLLHRLGYNQFHFIGKDMKMDKGLTVLNFAIVAYMYTNNVHIIITISHRHTSITEMVQNI